MHQIYHSPSPGLFRLIWAKDFYDPEQTEIYTYKKNFLEKIGNVFRWGIGSFLDITLKNIKKPIVIIALTALAMFVVTIAIYHVVAYQILVTLLPFMTKITPWMIKALLYAILQTTLGGIALRTIGRLNNPQLMEKYTKGELQPLYIGAHRKV